MVAGPESEGDSHITNKDGVQVLLRKIANTVENWNTLPKDDAAVVISVSTPDGAMRYSASTIRDAQERQAVEAALPLIVTEDFAEAARQIREVADR